jgi:hypothetical protein
MSFFNELKKLSKSLAKQIRDASLVRSLQFVTEVRSENETLKELKRFWEKHGDLMPDYSESEVRKVANFFRGNSAVSTHYGDGVFRTTIRDEKYDKNKFVLVQEYENSDDAMVGHAYWTNALVNDKLPELIDKQKRKSKKFKITYKALIKILIPYASKANQLRVQEIEGHAGRVTLTILNGIYRGTCLYDSKTMEVSNISDLWSNLIEEAQAYAYDKQAQEDGLANNSDRDIYTDV